MLNVAYKKLTNLKHNTLFVWKNHCWNDIYKIFIYLKICEYLRHESNILGFNGSIKTVWTKIWGP